MCFGLKNVPRGPRLLAFDSESCPWARAQPWAVRRKTSILLPTEFSLCKSTDPNCSHPHSSPKKVKWPKDTLCCFLNSLLSPRIRGWDACEGSARLVPQQKISRGRDEEQRCWQPCISLSLYSCVSGFVGHSSTLQLPHNSLGQATSD